MLREWALSRAKELADALTLTRVFIAAAILVAAVNATKESLGPVVLLTMLGWTTDVFDGKLARADNERRNSWVGNHEFVADMLMVYSGLAYYVAAGFIPGAPFAAYVAFSGLVALIWQNKSYTMAVAAPVVAMPLIFSLIHAPFVGFLFLGWIALALLLFWDRFRVEVIDFIGDVDEG